MTVFNDTFDKAAPDGGDDPVEADNNMRRIQAAIQERENVDHYWPLDGTEVSDASTGEHRKVTLRVGSAPAAVADKGFVYAKNVNDKAELFYRDEDGDEIQLTSGGKLGAATIDLLAKNGVVAGTLGVTGVLTTTAAAVLGDGSKLAAATETGDNDRTIVDLAYAKTGDTVQHDSQGGFTNADVDSTKTKVYSLYLTGTLDNDSATNVPHGITGIDNILHCSINVFNSTNGEYTVSEQFNSSGSPTINLQVNFDGTNVIFSGVGTQLQGQKYKIKLDYIL